MYQYKNIAYLGILIFLLFMLLNQIFEIFNYHGLIGNINKAINTVQFFSMILFPIAFITSIFVTISNVILVKKEGFSLKNILGILAGILFCFSTLLPGIINDILQNSKIVDVHNMQSVYYYMQMFLETLIYGIVSYLECILLGTIILGIISAKHIPSFDKDYIIILGCKIRKDKRLTSLLKSRVARALEFRNMQKDNTGKDLVFVVSGGKGPDEEISEAEAMKIYLLKKGIEEKNILVENNSKSTLENIKFSNEIINKKSKNSKIAFCTTNYHVFRAGILATSLGIKAEGIGAKTKTYFWINAFIREFVATLNFEKKQHISVISNLVLISIMIILTVYLSNVI